MNETPLLKRKPVTIVFALISFIGGFLFLNHSLTGNVVINESYYLDIVSLIGLSLIICSLILAFYTIKHKER